jgi:hypothetical protein
LGKLPILEPRLPELPDQLIDLGLVATAARTLDVVHPAPSRGSDRIGNHGDYRTLTFFGPDSGVSDGWSLVISWVGVVTASCGWMVPVAFRAPSTPLRPPRRRVFDSTFQVTDSATARRYTFIYSPNCFSIENFWTRCARHLEE